MRRSIYAFMALAVFTFANKSAFCQDNENDNHSKTKIIGSGNVTTRDVPVQSFDQVEAKGVFDISIRQGDKESVKVEAEDNLQPLVLVRNEGNKLVIETKEKPQYTCKKRMVIDITVRDLKVLNLSMVGNFYTEGNLNVDNLSLENKSVGSVDIALTTQRLDIKNSAVGNLRLKGKAENVSIHSSSVGAIRAGDLIAQTVDIENDGIGSAEVNATKELKVNNSFLGKVRNVGNASTQRTRKVVI